MEMTVFWVPGPWKGKLGILPRPRGGEWLGDETDSWRRAGIDWVVSLLEPREAAELDLEGEAAALADSGIEYRSFPIPDRGTPFSREPVAKLINEIVDALTMGRNVGVHCRQGIGRSALIVGAVLVADGFDPAAALKTIQESRGIEVPETAEQRQWFNDFASWLAATSHSRPAASIRERSHG